MSKFVVDVNKPKTEVSQTAAMSSQFGENQTAKKSGVFLKALKIFGVLLFLFLAIGGIGGYFYWQNLKKTPQYSLALLIDAARRDDQKRIDELVDTNSVVENFVPQITDKAVELYGRNLPPATLARVAQIAAPLMPAVKDRARTEIPNLIREKTKKFEKVPFQAIALGADRYVEITQDSNKAFVNNKLQDRPLQLTLKRSGDRWQVVSIKDDELAQQIADKIGQELIALAQKGGLKKAGETLGVQNLNDMLKELDGVFK